MPGTNKWHVENRTRRGFLATSAIGTAALAGCFGGDGDEDDDPGQDNESGNGDTNQNGDETEVHDARFRIFDPEGTNPSDRHFNPWNPSNPGAWHPGAAVFDKLAVYSPASDEAYPLIAESWEMTGDTTLEAQLSDEWEWHNGDPVVAEDWTMQADIIIELARAAAEDDDESDPHLMESVEAPDDHTVRVNLSEPLSEIFAVQNSIGMYHDLVGRGIFTKHDDDQWSDWHERLLDGDESAIEEITSTAYPQITDDPIGNGPFEVSEVGDNEIVLQRYDGHPHADTINFERMSLQVFADQEQIFPAFNGGEVHAAHSQFPLEEGQMNQLSDSVELFREGRSANNLITFNCGSGVQGYDTPFDSPNVRKAVAHVYDRQGAQSLLQGQKQLFEYPPCRVPHAVLEDEDGQIAGLDIEEEFTLYGQNDTDRATELLEEEGYSLEDGEWYDPDGDRFEVMFMNGEQDPQIQWLGQNLNDFGIQTSQETFDSATFEDRRSAGEYDIMPDGSSANGQFAMWAPDLVIEWLSSIVHFDTEAEIPMPIGDPDGSSGTKTIDVAEHINSWMVEGDQQYHQELMWWWNQHIPEFEVLWQPDAGGIDTANWELDAPDPIYSGVDDALYVAPKMEDAAIRYNP